MNTKQAFAKLQKILGPKAGYRIDEKASPELRAKAKTDLYNARIAENNAKIAMEKRRAELLADPVYQELLITYQVAKTTAQTIVYSTMRYRITVGDCDGLFFHVKAEGDNWEKVLAKLKPQPKED